jgi:quinol monooxygenase YgiN
MLYVIARIEARPERHADVRDALLELTQSSRIEPGCMRYDLLEDEARHVFVTREEWRTVDDEQAHMAGAAVAQAFAAVGDALAAPPDILRLTAVSMSQG